VGERIKTAFWVLGCVYLLAAITAVVRLGPPLLFDLVIAAGWALVAVSLVRSARDYRRSRAKLRAAAADWRARNPAPR
jgi:hypothetical protein